ncbi:hypothetical protein IGI04_002863 [Brassica rapa subsp. trilocularis]|uniref:Uncharacterized protein n=1 Tax=Brassica rapa subsp. trilocularis TaxID=1813537 RepID=A0ABQ7NYT6_BRACM|nr:hypothetical protein IGI04_002863 [Brassica rapa subsp. trilocularis]
MIFGSKITRSDLQVSLREVAPGPIFGVSGREVASDFGVSLQRVALDRERPWKVALRSGTQRLRDVVPGGRSHARLAQWSPFHLF